MRGLASLLVVRASLVVLLSLISGLALSSTVPYSSCFMRSAAANELPVSLLKAVAATESNFNPSARSHANAHGVMQIQWPGTAKHLGVSRVAQLYSPCKNIEWGARYLREMLNKYGNDEHRALAAYNYGPGRIKSTGTLPSGAQKYIATVSRHRARFSPRADLPKQKRVVAKKLVVNKAKVAASGQAGQAIVSFSSRLRAQRYAKLLQSKIPAARFVTQKARFGRHSVVLTTRASALSSDGRTLLISLGWKPTTS